MLTVNVPSIIELKDVFTLGCAITGAVLGVLNTWHGLSQRRVKLKVLPKFAYGTDDGKAFLTASNLYREAGATPPPMGCIDITNLSPFPVTVGSAGFTMKGDESVS